MQIIQDGSHKRASGEKSSGFKSKSKFVYNVALNILIISSAHFLKSCGTDSITYLNFVII